MDEQKKFYLKALLIGAPAAALLGWQALKWAGKSSPSEVPLSGADYAAFHSQEGELKRPSGGGANPELSEIALSLNYKPASRPELPAGQTAPDEPLPEPGAEAEAGAGGPATGSGRGGPEKKLQPDGAGGYSPQSGPLVQRAPGAPVAPPKAPPKAEAGQKKEKPGGGKYAKARPADKPKLAPAAPGAFAGGSASGAAQAVSREMDAAIDAAMAKAMQGMADKKPAAGQTSSPAVPPGQSSADGEQGGFTKGEKTSSGERGCQSGAANYLSAVLGAIYDYAGENPSVMQGDEACHPPFHVARGRENDYVRGVAAILMRQGYSARQQPWAGDILAVKKGPEFHEEYDILTSNNCARAFGADTCSPAGF